MQEIAGTLTDVAQETVRLYVEVSIYLLFGFFVAGILYLAFPRDFVAKHLGKGSIGSVLKASLFGIPLPLCSCGVIPTALALRKRGASRGATLSFMVSTPQTGVDSILITGGLFGLPYALLRALFSMITATVTGLLSNLFGLHDDDGIDIDATEEAVDAGTKPTSWKARLVDMMKYAYVDMLGSIYKWLLVGLLVAGLIGALVPTDALKGELGQGIWGKLLMLLVGIPMYICATASTPMAFVAWQKGMSLGGVFVFLMAGPATNAATITVVAKTLGKRSVVIYVASIAVVSILCGIAIDATLAFWPELAPRPTTVGDGHEHPTLTPLQIAGAIVLGLLILNLVVRDLATRLRPRAAEAEPDTLVLRVDGMTCQHCKGTVERVVAALPGIASVEVNLAKSLVAIRPETALPSVNDIRAAIEQEGYDVVDEP